MRNPFKRLIDFLCSSPLEEHIDHLDKTIEKLHKIKRDLRQECFDLHSRNRQLGERVVQLEEGLGANQEIAELREALAREVETNMKLSADNEELRKALPHDQ